MGLMILPFALGGAHPSNLGTGPIAAIAVLGFDVHRVTLVLAVARV